MNELKSEIEITIRNIASFGDNPDSGSLKTAEKINLVYGLNGTGKTTIANYLNNLANEDYKECEYKDCGIEGFDPANQKILVYNKQFVSENFYECPTQKGVFTLSKENKVAQQAIERAETEKKSLEEELKVKKQPYQDKEEQISQEVKNLEEKIWGNVKQKYENTIFDEAGFLNGFKNVKRKLCNHIKELSLEKVETSIEEIKQKLQPLISKGGGRELLENINGDEILKIEGNSIFQERIIGNESSPVADLIEKLGNSDWVKKGLDKYTSDKQDKCPFCQQSVNQQLLDNLEKYFDEEYKQQKQVLENLRFSYEDNIKSINNIENYKIDFLSREKKEELKSLFLELQSLLKENLAEIKDKFDNPSISIEIESSREKFNEIKQFITAINEETNQYNDDIKNKEQLKEELKQQFWQIQRSRCDVDIELFEKNYQRLNEELKVLKSEQDKISEDIKNQDAIIKDNQNQVVGIDAVIDKINNHLSACGIQDFKMVKHKDQEYKIVRERDKQGNNEGVVFVTLSEGEKNVISFFYFVELCIGKQFKKETKKKIIVIDDPISSLSHMYVFNIACLIEKYFMCNKSDDIIKVFVLTHNFYFFNELSRNRQCKSKIERFMITKKDYSNIKGMKEDEILNEYEAYWHIVKNDDQSYLLPNAMRNIIEYFFGFIANAKDLKTIFQDPKLDDYQDFRRYMDRESHSDLANHYMFKDFNREIFKNAFKLVFKVSGHEKHYKKMMGSTSASKNNMSDN